MTQRPYPDKGNNDITSLSWDAEDITFGTPPTSLDEWEESNEEKEEPGANRTSTGETESDDSLPDLVSDTTEEEDDGFALLNTPPSTEERETEEEKSTNKDKDEKNSRCTKRSTGGTKKSS